MCGIVGAVAHRNVVPILIEGLKRLEYRGYDSAGIAVVNGEHCSGVRSTGRVATLERMAHEQHRCTADSASRTRAGPRTARPPRATPIRMCQRRQSRSCTTASSRTTRRCARELRAPGLRASCPRPTPRSSRTWCTRYLAEGGDSVRGRAARRSRELAGRLRHRGASPSSEPERLVGRAHGRAAAARPGRAARTSPPPTPRRCCRSRNASIYLEEGDVRRDARATAIAIVDADGAAGRARGARAASCRPTRSSSARTATTCRRRSSSSRARSPTRSRW